MGRSGEAGWTIGRRGIVDTTAQGRSFKMRNQIGTKTEQDRLSSQAMPTLHGKTLIDRVMLVRIGPPGEICGLVYPVTNPVTFRVRLCRQCKARCAVNGQPFTSSATRQWRHRRSPFGRARKRPSAALRLLERAGPFPARHALRLTASWLAECYRIGDGVH